MSCLTCGNISILSPRTVFKKYLTDLIQIIHLWNFWLYRIKNLLGLWFLLWVLFITFFNDLFLFFYISKSSLLWLPQISSKYLLFCCIQSLSLSLTYSGISYLPSTIMLYYYCPVLSWTIAMFSNSWHSIYVLE